MSIEVNVAVLGATGLVGKQMIECLEETQVPVKKLFPLASSRSAGQDVRFRGEENYRRRRSNL